MIKLVLLVLLILAALLILFYAITIAIALWRNE